MILMIIKKIVYGLCLLYTVNVIICGIGKNVPINVYTIFLVMIFDLFAIFALIYLKYYM